MSNKQENNTDDLIGQLCDGLEEKCGTFCVIRNILPWLFFSVIYVFALSYYLGFRHDLSDILQNPVFLFDMGMASMIFLTAAISSAYFTLPDQKQFVWIKYIPLTIIGVFFFWIGVRLYTEGLQTSFFAQGMSCVQRGIIIESIPVIGIILLSTRGHTTQPYWLIGMIVAAVMALGWIGLRITCSIDDMVYSLVFHLLPFGLTGAVIAFFARKLFKW